MATDGITTGVSGLVAGTAMRGVATGTTGMEMAGTTAVALGRVGTSGLMWTAGDGQPSFSAVLGNLSVGCGRRWIELSLGHGTAAKRVTRVPGTLDSLVG